MKSFVIKDLVLISIFAALTAVGAFLNIPFPTISFTLQVFFVLLTGALLGSARGTIAICIYLLIGLLGVPVFSQGGGFTYVFRPSFGYLLGFVLCAFVVGFLTRNRKTLVGMMLALLAGVVAVYFIGLPYQYLMMKYYLHNDIAAGLLTIKMLPYMALDLVKALAAALLAHRLRPVLEKYMNTSRK